MSSASGSDAPPRRWLAAASALALLWAPGAARACSVCFTGEADNRVAFLVTTIGLTALPLLMIGGLVLWLRQRFRELEAQAPDPRAVTGPPLR